MISKLSLDIEEGDNCSSVLYVKVNHKANHKYKYKLRQVIESMWESWAKEIYWHFNKWEFCDWPCHTAILGDRIETDDHHLRAKDKEIMPLRIQVIIVPMEDHNGWHGILKVAILGYPEKTKKNREDFLESKKKISSASILVLEQLKLLTC